jgi:signal transduction histidine kinase
MSIFYSVVKNPKNTKILVATLLLGMIFLGGFTYESYSSYHSEIHRAEIETINLTRVLQEHVNGSFKSTDLILMELQKIVQDNRDKLHQENKTINKIFLDKRLNLPQMRSFKAVNKNGEYIVDDGGLQNYFNVRDREYFQELKKSEGDVLVISKPIISKTNHIWVIVLARKVLDAQGHFDGVVMGTISLEYFRQQFEKLDLGSDGLIGLNDLQLVTHMRIPWSERFLGKSPPVKPEIKEFLDGPKLYITIRTASSYDGIERLVTVRKLENYPFVVAVGMSTDRFLNEWKNRTIIYIVSTVILCSLFIIFLFIFLYSQERFESQRQQAIQASKLSSLGEMAGGIAHEINNPLTIISALATRTKKNLLDKNIPLEKSLENLDKIVGTVDRIARIIRGLRSFSRDSNGDSFIHKKVSEIIEMTLDLCQERMRDNGVSLKLGRIPQVEIECREVQIVQVLVNLLNNSLDAINDLPQKWIEINVVDMKTKVEISITDSGAGIDPRIIEKMMVPFFTTKEIGKGTGLGLSISKGIIEAHQGKFYYQLNNGHTSFVLELNKHLKIYKRVKT